MDTSKLAHDKSLMITVISHTPECTQSFNANNGNDHNNNYINDDLSESERQRLNLNRVGKPY